MLYRHITNSFNRSPLTRNLNKRLEYVFDFQICTVRGLKNDSSNLQHQMQTKKIELQGFIDNKKSEIQEKLDDKKEELQNSILNSQNDIKEFIEDTKVEIIDKVQEKSIEISQQKKKVKSQAILSIADRSIVYLINYGQVLKTAFPDRFVKTYRIFSSGTKQLTRDLKTYYNVKDTLVNSIDINKAHGSLTRSDYEVRLSLPKDAMRVAPVLLISALPFAQNVVFPLALLYPKVFLSSQFLTPEQKDEILLSHAQAQQQIYPKLREELIRCTDMTYEKDADLMNFRKVLQSGKTLTPEEILDLRPLFELEGPLDIRHLTRRHDKLLASFHRVSYFMFPYKHLERYSNLLWRMDQALIREDLKFPVEGLNRLSVQRGLNPKLYSDDEKMAYIHSWLNISRHLKYKDISLLLHLPVFLANKRQPLYNQ